MVLVRNVKQANMIRSVTKIVQKIVKYQIVTKNKELVNKGVNHPGKMINVNVQPIVKWQMTVYVPKAAKPVIGAHMLVKVLVLVVLKGVIEPLVLVLLLVV